MAKIIDGDDLNVGTELTIDTSAKTFTLNVAGNLVAKDGVTIQALYSKFIKLWETSTYNKYPFPMYAIDALSGQFQFGTDGSTNNGWKPADDATRTYLRDGGWSEYSNAGVLQRQYVGIVSLGDVSAGAQLYYQRASSDAPTDFTFTDEVNQGIQVLGDASNGNFDKRTYFKGFVREYGKKYKDSVLADTGKTATGAYLVNLLLSNENDLDIVDTDTDVITTPVAPYDSMKIRYLAADFNRDIDTVSSPRAFGIVVDVGTHSNSDGSTTNGGTTLTSAIGGIPTTGYVGGTLTIYDGTAKGTYNIASTTATTVVITGSTFPAAASGASFTIQRATPVQATLQEIYTFLQAKLRQATNINDVAGGTSVTGKTASLLANFVGSRLDCGFYAPTNPAGGGSGVLIQGLRNADSNSVRFYDNTATSREYPYTASGTLNFNSFLTAGSTGYYRMYFTDPTGSAGDAYGEAGAITVNDASGAPITGTITGSSIAFTYDYSNNSQHSPINTDVSVTIVAGNKGNAKPVVATGTLTASKTMSFTLTAEQDRAYVA